jgi:hypothetical protein
VVTGHVLFHECIMRVAIPLSLSLSFALALSLKVTMRPQYLITPLTRCLGVISVYLAILNKLADSCCQPIVRPTARRVSMSTLAPRYAGNPRLVYCCAARPTTTTGHVFCRSLPTATGEHNSFVDSYLVCAILVFLSGLGPSSSMFLL